MLSIKCNETKIKQNQTNDSSDLLISNESIFMSILMNQFQWFHSNDALNGIVCNQKCFLTDIVSYFAIAHCSPSLIVRHRSLFAIAHCSLSLMHLLITFSRH
jgi:hypothetical protein